MKVFNYQCTNETCQHTFEAFVKSSDQVVQCEKCQSPTEKRLTMPAFTLNGEGFYSRGTFAKAKDGPKLDKDLLRLSDRELNKELGLDCLNDY